MCVNVGSKELKSNDRPPFPALQHAANHAIQSHAPNEALSPAGMEITNSVILTYDVTRNSALVQLLTSTAQALPPAGMEITSIPVIFT